jgi:hypothetical protein
MEISGGVRNLLLTLSIFFVYFLSGLHLEDMTVKDTPWDIVNWYPEPSKNNVHQNLDTDPFEKNFYDNLYDENEKSIGMDRNF